MKTKKYNPIHGFLYLLRGFTLLTKPGLRRFVIMPTLINILLFALLMASGTMVVDHLAALLPHGFAWLKWIILPLFFIASGIFIFYTFTIIANLIASPFNSFLSEKVELIASGGKINQNANWQDALKEIPRALKREWQKIKYYLPRVLLLLALTFIPVINIVAGFLWFIFGSWMMATEYIDYTFDNHKIDFNDMQKWLRSHCLLSLGFGCVVMIVSMIPIVNFFVMPAAVIGATLLKLEIKR